MLSKTLASAFSVFTLTLPFIAAANDGPQARVAKFDGDRAAAISYTFDDGIEDQFTLAVPMLNEVGFKATFFVIAGRVAETPADKGHTPADAAGASTVNTISWLELKEMAAKGHEIASHTYLHRIPLPKMKPDVMQADLKKTYDTITAHIGKPPLTVAFPWNAWSPEVLAEAMKYHVAYRSAQMATNGKSTVAFLNSWADGLIRQKKWGVTLTHGIAKGFDALSDPEILHSHLKYVKSREREIWVDTFSNVSRYEKERDGATLTCTGSAGHMRFSLTDELDAKLYDVPLTIVIDAQGATSASALRAGKPLPARIENNSIYVQAVPDTDPVTVTWK